MTELSWGRRYLMCPPHHFGVLYEINPWMHEEVAVEHDRASQQWQDLVGNLRLAGAEVVTMDPQPEVPDLVFTANAGHRERRRSSCPSHFRHPERQGETEIDAAWFADAGLPGRPAAVGARPRGRRRRPPLHPRRRRHRARVRATPSAATRPPSPSSARLLGCPIKAVQLVDPRLYHLDLTFCPLDERRALCAPTGWDSYGRKVIEALVPEPLWLEEDEALSFCANSVVVGTTIVMPNTPPRVGRQLEQWGFTVVESPVDEFLKAGGGCRCLTLALDTVLT